MVNWSQIAKSESEKKLTENGQLAYTTTGNPLLDFFSTVGALRDASEERITRLFDEAYAADPDGAIETVFYAGDIRGGLGERRVFRILISHMKDLGIDFRLSAIPQYNRWDSIFSAMRDWYSSEEVLELISTQIGKDIAEYTYGGEVSLLAKWLPSINSRNIAKRQLAYRIANYLGMSAKQYRQLLSALRRYLNVVEVKMSAQKFDEIDYEKVPSRAMALYRFAFWNRDGDRFQSYMEAVSRGEKKINSSTLFPYDLVEKYLNFNSFHLASDEIDPVVEAQWKALPNYCTKGGNVMVMADTSGSMYGRPICSSIGLAIYFAERNTGPLHNTFMTFSENPRIVHFDDDENTLQAKVKRVASPKYVGYNTNLEAAFTELLNCAIVWDIKPGEMPSMILAISDMEIDAATPEIAVGGDFVKTMRMKYDRMGYELPKIVFWNVNSRHDTFLSRGGEDIILVSGNSTTTFKEICELVDGKTMTEFMNEILDRYEDVLQ